MIDQTIDIEFYGYVQSDNTQVVDTNIYYNDTKLDTSILSTFQMSENLYVDNTLLKDYNKIYFNGSMSLKFFKEWFECNLLQGSYIKNNRNFLHRATQSYTDEHLRVSRDVNEYDVVCIGCSYTYGAGVAKESSWPSLLGQKLNKSVGNFGVHGTSIHGCYRQLVHCLKNYKIKKIILLLPKFERKLCRFNFLGNWAHYNFTAQSPELGPYQMYDYKDQMKKMIKHSRRNGERLIKYMTKLNENIYLTSWDKEVYDSIPADENKKLPLFPDLDAFPERSSKKTSDGLHPHRNHYQLFVNNIKPYVDKI